MRYYILKSLKEMFKNKEIEIVVCEAEQSEEEETAYLRNHQLIENVY